ncbi:hypothetical protein J3A83DRAFT_4373229 [Scleroderma citrinum]
MVPEVGPRYGPSCDVPEPGLLHNSKWFRRGWTLQELLAPFFARDWSLYKDGALNHKEDSVDNARSRFQWVSGRFTTRPEDIAYSLLGIFGLHMPVLYGESAEIALGRLLAEVILTSGDTSVLD